MTTALENTRFRMEETIRELQAELAAAQAQIRELENIIAWAEPKHAETPAHVAADAEAHPAAVAGGDEGYAPGLNAHPEGKEVA